MKLLFIFVGTFCLLVLFYLFVWKTRTLYPYSLWPQLQKVGSVIVGLTVILMVIYWHLLSSGFQLLISVAFPQWDGLDSYNVADVLT